MSLTPVVPVELLPHYTHHTRWRWRRKKKKWETISVQIRVLIHVPLYYKKSITMYPLLFIKIIIPNMCRIKWRVFSIGSLSSVDSKKYLFFILYQNVWISFFLFLHVFFFFILLFQNQYLTFFFLSYIHIFCIVVDFFFHLLIIYQHLWWRRSKSYKVLSLLTLFFPPQNFHLLRK